MLLKHCSTAGLAVAVCSSAVWLGRQRGQEDRNMSAGARQHGLKEQFTPYYRSDSYKGIHGNSVYFIPSIGDRN